jgi:hypothetical protein
MEVNGQLHVLWEGVVVPTEKHAGSSLELVWSIP